jgi:hypothetical protein
MFMSLTRRRSQHPDLEGGTPPGGVPAAVAIITILILTSQTGQCVGRVAIVADIPLMLAVLSNLN